MRLRLKNAILTTLLSYKNHMSFEQFPQNVSNQEEQSQEADKKQTAEKKESWLKRNARKLTMGVTGAAMLTSAVEGKELKNTANEEFSKQNQKNKKELVVDTTEKQGLDFPTWKAARIGDYGEGKNSDLIKNLAESNIKLNLDLEVLRTIKLSEKQQYREFVRVMGKELGLTKGAKYKDLLETAARHDLVLVPAEAVPQLLIQNDLSDTTVERPEQIRVAMSTHQYDEKKTGTESILGDPYYTRKIREETGREPKVVFVIQPGGKDSQTSLNTTSPLQDNDLLDLNQSFMFMKKKNKDNK